MSKFVLYIKHLNLFMILSLQTRIPCKSISQSVSSFSPSTVHFQHRSQDCIYLLLVNCLINDLLIRLFKTKHLAIFSPSFCPGVCVYTNHITYNILYHIMHHIISHISYRKVSFLMLGCKKTKKTKTFS